MFSVCEFGCGREKFVGFAVAFRLKEVLQLGVEFRRECYVKLFQIDTVGHEIEWGGALLSCDCSEVVLECRKDLVFRLRKVHF